MSVVIDANVPSYIFRDFITKRLSAVAEEIFSVFEQTVDKYEKEIDRQRRLLDASGKPGTSELPQASVKDEAPLKRQHWEQNKTTSVDHGEIQHSLIKNEEYKDIEIKVEQEESCSSQEMVSPFEKNIHHQHQRVNESCQQKSTLEKKELLQQLFYDKSDVSTAQTHHSPKHIQRLNPDEADPLQTTEEQVEPWPTQDGERPSLTQETDVLMVTVPNGGSDENQCHVMNAHFNPASTEAIAAGPVRKRVKCDLCGNGFRNKSKLRVHMRIHTGEKPYPCETCGKRFRRSHALAAHRRIHTGEKPFDCKVCGRFYRTRGHVTEHMRMHTGEKPYHCGTCDKRFSRLSNLTIHRRIHTGVRYSCATCGKSYSQQATLRRHWKLHSLEEIVIP